MPGRATSKVYLALPLTLSGPSSRVTRLPTTVGALDQLYFGSTGCGGGPPRPPCALATLDPLHARHGLEDAVERAAAADVAVEPFLDLLGRRVGMFLEQADTGHDEPRGAEAAHQRILLAEGLLDRVERCAAGEPVDVADLLALD